MGNVLCCLDHKRDDYDQLDRNGSDDLENMKLRTSDNFHMEKKKEVLKQPLSSMKSPSR